MQGRNPTRVRHTSRLLAPHTTTYPCPRATAHPGLQTQGSCLLLFFHLRTRQRTMSVRSSPFTLSLKVRVRTCPGERQGTAPCQTHTCPEPRQHVRAAPPRAPMCVVLFVHDCSYHAHGPQRVLQPLRQPQPRQLAGLAVEEAAPREATPREGSAARSQPQDRRRDRVEGSAEAAVQRGTEGQHHAVSWDARPARGRWGRGCGTLLTSAGPQARRVSAPVPGPHRRCTPEAHACCTPASSCPATQGNSHGDTDLDNSDTCQAIGWPV